MKLRASDHPVSGAKLPQPTMMDGTPVNGIGTYSNLKGGEGRVPDGFVRYEPEVVVAQPKTAARGRPASVKRARMVAMVKLREACAKKKRRMRDAEEEAKVLYEEFLGETGMAVALNEVAPFACETDDEDSRVFWNELDAESAAGSVFKHCAVAPRPYVHVQGRRSRLERLMG